jgi:hypothetical protein
MDQLRAIKYFVKTAEVGNFTGAAAILNEAIMVTVNLFRCGAELS